MLMTLPCDSPFLIPTVLPPKQQVWDLTPRWERKMENLLEEVEQLFQSQLGLNELLSMSRKLQAESTTRIRWSPRSMLPSHNYNLPTGEERGTYLVLDVGGSTLRVAMVELNGRQRGQGPLRIRRMECHPIDASIKALKDVAFFDWIAGKIDIMLASDKGYRQSGTEPLAMGVAWSFPIKSVYIPRCLCPLNADESQADVDTKRQAFEHGKELRVLGKRSRPRPQRSHNQSLSTEGRSLQRPLAQFPSLLTAA